jgi:hypothetical protein
MGLEWNDHEHHRKREFHGEWSKWLVLGEDRLEVRVHRGCLNYLNGMQLENNAQMTFSSEIFH